jgi:hypothetical protein
VSPQYFRSVDPRLISAALFAPVDGRPGTKVVAGALRVCAVLIVVGAVAGVALFRAELLKLVPFVGATGMAPPVIFAVLVSAAGLLFWGLADALVMLADHARAHRVSAVPAAEHPAPRAVAAPPRTDKSPGLGDVPGFQRYQRPMPRIMKWTANVTNGPAYLAKAVCEVASGELVTAIGEVAEFAFVETSAGNGWLPKDALTDLAASA